jgi:hypothetical protein
MPYGGWNVPGATVAVGLKPAARAGEGRRRGLEGRRRVHSRGRMLPVVSFSRRAGVAQNDLGERGLV